MMHSLASVLVDESRASAVPTSAPIVFVVDDDISVRESLEALLGDAGWQPEVFASAQEFLARSRVFSPSCLILDVSLPDLSGLELQKRIAERTDLPIIFITGYGDIPMTVQAIRAVAVGTRLTPRPPLRSERALLTHSALALDV
jgi:FixJ family two-component response regulator